MICCGATVGVAGEAGPGVVAAELFGSPEEPVVLFAGDPPAYREYGQPSSLRPRQSMMSRDIVVLQFGERRRPRLCTGSEQFYEVFFVESNRLLGFCRPVVTLVNLNDPGKAAGSLAKHIFNRGQRNA